jgi:hypothetical protein
MPSSHAQIISHLRYGRARFFAPVLSCQRRTARGTPARIPCFVCSLEHFALQAPAQSYPRSFSADSDADICLCRHVSTRCLEVTTILSTAVLAEPRSSRTSSSPPYPPLGLELGILAEKRQDRNATERGFSGEFLTTNVIENPVCLNRVGQHPQQISPNLAFLIICESYFSQLSV